MIAAAILGGLVVAAAFSLRRSVPTAAGARAAPAARPDPLVGGFDAFPWTDAPDPDFALPPYARFLEDVVIVLDPGHVGQRDRGGSWKRGPTGLREAEVNLRVAHFLRDFLLAAGANVTLTREIDESLDLADDDDLDQRAEVANRMQADLLLSIHHNAADSPKANYTTVWYHRGPDHSPASLDAARHILFGLHDALRLPQHVEVGLQNDFLIYPNGGFRLLRSARVPAVLSESSFHTNPQEEARLRDPLYNRREAYGLFLGMARWAKCGLPRARIVEPADGPQRGKPLTIALDDGLTSRGGMGREFPKIRRDSIRVELNGAPLPFEVDLRRGTLRVDALATRGSGPLALTIDFENVFGQHVLHPTLFDSAVFVPASSSDPATAAPAATRRRLESRQDSTGSGNAGDRRK